MNASPASEELAGLVAFWSAASRCDERLLLRYTADHHAAAYEGSRCAVSRPPRTLTADFTLS